MDFKTIQSVILDRLPVHARWMANDTPMDFHFSETLQILPDNLVESNPEWREFLIFCECVCGDGGGATPWLFILQTDGAVFGFDLERENPIYVLNSSLETFIRTFSLLNNYLR